MRNLRNGISEVYSGALNYHQWLYFGFQDIKLRYRRSTIGPWWVTLGTLLTILLLSLVWSSIFKLNLNDYLLYFTIGYVIWGWISGQVLEAATGYSQFQGVIKQIKIPITVFLFRICTRHLFVLAHNFVVIVLVSYLIGDGFVIASLLFIPGFFIVQGNIFFASNLVAILCTRFQDMTQIVNLAMQLIFFCTPIIWKADLIKNKTYLTQHNPFFHWIELLREPLIGSTATSADWLWSTATLIVLAVVSCTVLGKYRSKISFWV